MEEAGKEGGRSAQKIPRVSRHSDENILSANGGKLPGAKLNSAQGVAEKCTERRAESVPICTAFLCLLQL